MDCALCKRPIADYDVVFNRLELDDGVAVDICASCVEKFSEWQGRLIAKMFPTKLMKKRFG
ncbi:hypothetical protein COY28_00885 [Candidatus Woesearchaeota archaeon CG_4_10_14_0_2_um_filter_57_5]|nr:MAG: hypothetical protein COY28_00885 [Candidatus Woesearchaeota archaeon CG_4_10_14_0_2_um_filter_57_5]